jgi:hypothetical protein
MEYYCVTSIGLVAIIPRPGLPSAVQLFVAGQKWANYLSPEEAARAVASSSTGHERLDSLPCWGVPALLCGWKQSVALNISTGTLRTESPAETKQVPEDAAPEMYLAFDCGK